MAVWFTHQFHGLGFYTKSPHGRIRKGFKLVLRTIDASVSIMQYKIFYCRYRPRHISSIATWRTKSSVDNFIDTLRAGRYNVIWHILPYLPVNSLHHMMEESQNTPEESTEEESESVEAGEGQAESAEADSSQAE